MSQTTVDFQPQNLGQILDQAISIYRRNFLTFIGVIALVQIPLSVLQLLVSASPAWLSMTGPASRFTSEALLAYMGVLCLGVIALTIGSLVFLQGFGYGAIARAVVDYRLGHPVGVMQAYRNIRPHVKGIVGTAIVGGLVLVALIVWTIVPVVGWLTGPGMMYVLGAAVMPLLSMIVILEGKTGWMAVRRAWDLVRQRFWWVLGFTFILNLLAQFAITGPTMAMSMGMVGMSWVIRDPELQLLVTNALQVLAGSLGTVLVMPVMIAAYALMYLDLRVRNEGLDLAMQAAAPAEGEIQISDLAAIAPAEVSGQMFTSRELLYFGGMTAAVVGIYIAIMVVIFGILGIVMAASGLD